MRWNFGSRKDWSEIYTCGSDSGSKLCVFDVWVLNEVFWKRRNISHISLQRKIPVLIIKFQFVIIHIIPFEDWLYSTLRTHIKFLPHRNSVFKNKIHKNINNILGWEIIVFKVRIISTHTHIYTHTQTHTLHCVRKMQTFIMLHQVVHIARLRFGCGCL